MNEQDRRCICNFFKQGQVLLGEYDVINSIYTHYRKIDPEDGSSATSLDASCR